MTVADVETPVAILGLLPLTHLMMTFPQKLLHWGYLQNVWGWFHALSGGVLYLLARKAKLGARGALLFVGAVALAWELFEFSSGSKHLEAEYGSLEHFYYDSVGDITLTLAVAWLVSMGEKETK